MPGGHHDRTDPESGARCAAVRCDRLDCPSFDFAQWASEVHALAEERDAVILAHNYQVPGDPGRRRPRRRFAGPVPDRGHRAAVDDRVLRRALHGRDGEDPVAGQDRADPGRERRLLARRLDHRRPAAGLEGRAPRRRRRLLRQHHRRGEGRDRHLLHVVQRRRGRALDPRRHRGAVRPRPVPRRARPPDHSAGTTSTSGGGSATCTPGSTAAS